jgi:asparagine synthase (glutamine-hydrolysing)
VAWAGPDAAAAGLGEGDGDRRPALRLEREGEAGPSRATGDGLEVVVDGFLHDVESLPGAPPGGIPGERTPAERVRRAYRVAGAGVLGRLRGVFAVVLWDARRGRLLACRDPLGAHPLFYAEVGGGLVLSASIPALLRHPRVSRAVNRGLLADHLRHLWPPTDETYFAAVRRVRQGHLLRWDRDGQAETRHWDPAPVDRPVPWVREDELPRFDALLDQAVRRCAERGRVGVYLSGGLDSVSVAALATDHCRRTGRPDPWGLSLAFPDPGCSEEPVQREVAAQLGVPQVMLGLDEAVGPAGLLEAALALSGTWPWPLLNSATPAFHALGLAGRQRGCEVVLTGEGGDEWLAVSPFHAADCLRRGDLRGLASLLHMTRRSYNVSIAESLRHVVWRCGLRPLLMRPAARALLGTAPALLRGHRRRAIEAGGAAWLAPDPALRREMAARVAREVEEGLAAPRPDGFYLRNIRPMLESVVQSIEFEESHERGRRLGVHLLHPFWDADLVEFLYRTPPRLLMADGRSKGLVRQTLARRFPALGFDRQKKVLVAGFYRNILLADGPRVWRRMGGASALAELGVVDGAAVTAALEGIFRRGDPSGAHHVWDVLNLETWLRPRL